MKKKLDELLSILNDKREPWQTGIAMARELLLSNLNIIAQVPVETFKEEKRAGILMERFLASRIPEPNLDEVDNVAGVIQGKSSEKKILLFAHMDHQPDMTIDPNIMMSKDRVTGRGVPEDNMALATLITLPDILARMELEFASDIILLACTRSHGRGDLEGIRHFLDQYADDIHYGINLIGIPLGTIDYFSLARVRCDINCLIDREAEPAWSKFINTSAILAINEVINQISSILLPKQPKTTINIGIITGGERYSTVSTHAGIKLEVLSQEDDLMDSVIEEIHDRCIDVGAKNDVLITTDFFSRHQAAGLTYSHPLVKTGGSIIDMLGYRPNVSYNNSEIAIPLSRGIPTISLGVTTGAMSGKKSGHVNLAPLPSGILQIIMLLYAIDQGYCDG
jgi:tripeptide aminopeptidase